MKNISVMSIRFAISGIVRLFINSVLFSIAVLLISCATEKVSTKHEFEIIELKEYYDGKGAIIPATSSQNFVGRPDVKRITITKEQAREGESILQEGFYNYQKKFFEDGRFYYWQTYQRKEDTLKLFNKKVAEMRQRLKEYYRYYVGFVNNKNNEEMVNIYLFELSREYSNWQDEYIFGSEEKDRGCYHVNLTKKEIEYERE